jgi:hypothetical protein
MKKTSTEKIKVTMKEDCKEFFINDVGESKIAESKYEKF